MFSWARRVRIEEDAAFLEREQMKVPQTEWKLDWLWLSLLIALVYAPFLHLRPVRPAGDDKVYVAQALEMERDGSWFVQTLSDEPDYRKGPFHYLALRVGYKVFGHNMWATLYMNFILVILGALAVAQLAGRHLGGSANWAFWAGGVFALNAGIYSHVFASQMEVELAAMFAIALYALDRLREGGEDDWIFWLIVGLAGTIKAPLHAGFLGITALLFWYLDGTWRNRITSWRAWAGVGLGILFCVGAYLPAALSDWQNFSRTFFGRENFDKGSNGAPWHYPIIPLFTYFLFPWTLPVFVAYADGFRRLWLRARGWSDQKKLDVIFTSGHERLVILGLCLLAPSILFFLFHGYRGQNYHLPVISGLVLVVAALWSTATPAWKRIYIAMIFVTAILLLAFPIALTFLVQHFHPMPRWWSDWTLAIVWVGTLLGSKGLMDEAWTFSAARPQVMFRKTVWIFIAAGALLVNLGEREMLDLKEHYRANTAAGRSVHYAYYNLHRNVWSEWAYLNFWAHVPVSGAHTEAGLKAAVDRGDYILVPGADRLAEFHKVRERLFPNYRVDIEPWRRWHTKAKNEAGESVWKDAWRAKDISLLERQHAIIRLSPPAR